MKQRNIRRTLLALALSAFGAGTIAQVPEVEPNNNVASATPLSVDSSGSVTATGAIGNASGRPVIADVDFYSFEGREGDTVTIDIDGAFRGTGTLDTVVTVFGPAPGYRLLRENDDASSLDPGSTSIRDSRIDRPAFNLPATGRYYVAVTPFRVFFSSYSTFRVNSPMSNGTYTLIISGVTPPIVQMNIEIKPGSGDFAPVNPKAKGNVPVALLGGRGFDPFQIDVNSLRFGAKGTEESLRRCGNDPVDVNGDGRMDRVCHFENELANWHPADLEGTLTGRMSDGRRFEGSAPLKVVPGKRDE